MSGQNRRSILSSEHAAVHRLLRGAWSGGFARTSRSAPQPVTAESLPTSSSHRQKDRAPTRHFLLWARSAPKRYGTERNLPPFPYRFGLIERAQQRARSETSLPLRTRRGIATI